MASAMSWDDYKPSEKATILSNEGEFIKGIEYYGRKWLLYAYNFELWEVVYDAEGNEIVSVEIMKSRRAGLYSRSVSIDGI